MTLKSLVTGKSIPTALDRDRLEVSLIISLFAEIRQNFAVHRSFLLDMVLDGVEFRVFLFFLNLLEDDFLLGEQYRFLLSDFDLPSERSQTLVCRGFLS